MANEYLVNKADLDSVADKINDILGTADALIFPSGFISKLTEIKNLLSQSSYSKLTFTEYSTYCSVSAKDTSISGSIIIPSTYNGKPVTEIDENGFQNCTEITSITIGDNITSIYMGAFDGCTGIAGIIISNSVNFIAPSVFTNLPHLTEIIIPASVANMGDNFYNCASDLTIYCEATSKPDGWIDNWCNTDCTIVWGYGQTVEYTVTITIGQYNSNKVANCLGLDNTIAEGETNTYSVMPLSDDTGTAYTLSATVTSAEHTFNATTNAAGVKTYTLTISNPTGPVTVEIDGRPGSMVQA